MITIERNRLVPILAVVISIGILMLSGCQPYGQAPEGQVCIPIEQAKELGILKGDMTEGLGTNEETNMTEELEPEINPVEEIETEEDTSMVTPVTEIKTEEKEEEPVVEQPSTEISGDLPKKVVKEGELVSFPNLNAYDPDGDPITYSFTPPLDENGEWQTELGDSGQYIVTITASDGKSESEVDVLIIVESDNAKPVISGLESFSVEEGEEIVLEPDVTDADGDDITVTYSGWMDSPTYQTTFNDAGEYAVTVTASDGTAQTTKTIRITVENLNRAPVLSDLKDIHVTEGDIVSVLPVAIDPDKDVLSFFYEEPLDENGEWETASGDAGTYYLKVSVSDGETTVDKDVKVVVAPQNKAPVITGLFDVEVDEGETVTLAPKTSDADGDKVTVTFSGWMESNSYTTTFEDAGVHTVIVTATDGTSETTEEVTVVVNDVNRPPVFDI